MITSEAPAGSVPGPAGGSVAGGLGSESVSFEKLNLMQSDEAKLMGLYETRASFQTMNQNLERFRSDITHPEEIALQRTRRIATNDDARLIIGIQKEQYISCLKRKASDLLESKRNDRRILLEELRTSTKAAHEFVESKVSDFQSTHLKFIQAAQALSISLSDELKSIYDQSEQSRPSKKHENPNSSLLVSPANQIKPSQYIDLSNLNLRKSDLSHHIDKEKIEAETLLSTIVDLERQKQTAMIEISNREQEMISIKLGQAARNSTGLNHFSDESIKLSKVATNTIANEQRDLLSRKTKLVSQLIAFLKQDAGSAEEACLIRDLVSNRFSKTPKGDQPMRQANSKSAKLVAIMEMAAIKTGIRFV